MYVKDILRLFYKTKNFFFVLDQDIIKLPLIVVVIGCVASILFLVQVLILVSNRQRGRSKENNLISLVN